MALGPRLDLRQSQSLVMTPQLQQAIKLLALSNLEVEAWIGDALASNPLLDIGEATASEPAGGGPDLDHGDLRQTHLETSPVDQLVREGRAAEDRPLDIDAGVLGGDGDGDGARDGGGGSAAEVPSGPGTAGDDYDASGYDTLGEAGMGPGASGSAAPDGDGFDPLDRHAASTTLADHLHAQIGTTTRDARALFIARWLIDQLDDAGYLVAPLAEAAATLGVDLAEVETALQLVQSLDPTGVGARTLGECLALQAREADRLDPCMARLLDHLELVARGEFARLRRICGVDEEDFADMLRELRDYDPKPGLRFGGGTAEAVVPDVLVRPRSDGGWDIALNQATLPRLVVNRPYYVELRGRCQAREAKGWLGERLAEANWLIKALDQRQKTILKVASEIVRQQEAFFHHGVAHLRPLTLKMVAEAVSLHESTVSRVTANKFLNCPRGTFELKYFFTSGVAAADGEGSVSAEAVKAAIRQLIEREEPHAILSDDTLVDLLKARGFDCARRTVAKYREAIGLGSSVQRRRQKALGQKTLKASGQKGPAARPDAAKPDAAKPLRAEAAAADQKALAAAD